MESNRHNRIYPALLVIFLASIFACDKPDLENVRSNNIENDGEVSIKVVKNEPNDTQVRLLNESRNTIFSRYDPAGNPPSFRSSTYTLTCKTGGTNDEDVSWQSHGLGPIRPVATGEHVDFQVRPTKRVNALCKISVRYFTNERALELIKKMVEKPGFDGYTDDEEQALKSMTKDISLELPVSFSAQDQK